VLPIPQLLAIVDAQPLNVGGGLRIRRRTTQRNRRSDAQAQKAQLSQMLFTHTPLSAIRFLVTALGLSPRRRTDYHGSISME
jgi:hypothetical protein